MRDRFKEWCETSDISVNEIDARASDAVENGQFPTMVYISLDLYAELQKGMASTMRYSIGQPASPNIMSIMTSSAGSLNIQPVQRLRNFLLVGRKEDLDSFTQMGVPQEFWNDQERIRIDKAFEDLIILEEGAKDA